MTSFLFNSSWGGQLSIVYFSVVTPIPLQRRNPRINTGCATSKNQCPAVLPLEILIWCCSLAWLLFPAMWLPTHYFIPIYSSFWKNSANSGFCKVLQVDCQCVFSAKHFCLNIEGFMHPYSLIQFIKPHINKMLKSPSKRWMPLLKAVVKCD